MEKKSTCIYIYVPLYKKKKKKEDFVYYFCFRLYAFIEN